MAVNNCLYIVFRKITDSKQMKVDKSKPCDQNTCSVVQKSVSFKQIYKDTDIIEIPLRETHSKLDNSEQKVAIHSIKNVLDDVSPIVTKTSSGDLKVALDKEILKLIEKKMKDNSKLFVELTKNNSGEITVDLHKDEISSNNNNILAKKTPSGNIVLEFDRKVSKKCISSFAKPTNKVRTRDLSCSTDKVLSHENLTKIILNTTNKKISGCRIKSNTKNLLKVRVKSNNNTASEVIFVIKQTDSGVYELILDKEFEKWYLQIIKLDYNEEEDAYFHVVRSNSGSFIMNINDRDDSESKNALLVRSDSGNNIKLIVIENESETEFIKKKFGPVIISPRMLSGFLNKTLDPCRETQIKNLKKSRTISKKSSSDSNVYGRVKFDIKNNQNLIESEAVLKKTDSGQYTVVLDKESKSAFIKNLEKTISSSSKGLIPIKRTSSGNIIVSLNSDLTSQYGSLKITKSGNMYVLLKKDTATGITTTTERSQSLDKIFDEEPGLSQNLNITKKVSSKATTTNCKGQCSETSCDESKCICDSNDYDSKEWVVGNAEIFFKNKGFATTALVNEDSNHNFKSKDKLIKNLPHIVIKPCGCRPILEKPTINGYGAEVQSICPYHSERYQELSNEILEISGLCQHDLDDKENEKHGENRTLTHSNKKILDWDSLQFLPPQLPLFLKDYSLL